MKTRKKKILIWVLSIVCVLVVAVSAVGYYAVNKAFSIIFDSNQLTEFVLYEDQGGATDAPDENVNDNDKPNVGNGETETSQPTPAPDIDNSSNKNDNAVPTQKPTSNKVSPTPSPIPASTPSPTPKKKVAMEYDVGTLEFVKDKITFADKAAILSICLKSLPASEIDNFMKMASNGVTIEEFKHMYSIYKASFKEEDREKLKKYFYKYENMVD